MGASQKGRMKTENNARALERCNNPPIIGSNLKKGTPSGIEMLVLTKKSTGLCEGFGRKLFREKDALHPRKSSTEKGWGG